MSRPSLIDDDELAVLENRRKARVRRSHFVERASARAAREVNNGIGRRRGALALVDRDRELNHPGARARRVLGHREGTASDARARWSRERARAAGDAPGVRGQRRCDPCAAI